jgi:hypothetical protein
MVTTPKGPGDASTAAASIATPSYLSIVPKLVLTVCIVFCEDHSRAIWRDRKWNERPTQSGRRREVVERATEGQHGYDTGKI